MWPVISQVIIAAVVVWLYHLWVSSRNQPVARTPEPLPAPKPAAPSQPVVLPQPVIPPAAVAVPAVAKTVEPETVAVIAAAIAVVLGRPYRVVSVQAAQGPDVNIWALEGRVEHFMSHRVR